MESADSEMHDAGGQTTAVIGRWGKCCVRHIHDGTSNSPRPQATLGFTWGPETIAVATELGPHSARCAAVVQLDGSLTSSDYRTGVEFTLGRCATQLRAAQVRLHAPLYADAATVTALEQDSVLGRALTLGRESHVRRGTE